MFYLSTIDLLIVGPSKTHTNGLGQTDGERFFGDRIDLEFTKDLNHRFAPFATVKTQNRS
jgi:hypothetical protein